MEHPDFDGAECFEMVVADEFDGWRTDKFLSEQLQELSRSYIQKLIGEGRVLVSGNAVKASFLVRTGDHIEVFMPPPTSLTVEPENIPLDILYEDADVILVNKGKNMVVHPAAGHYSGTLVNALLYHCKGNLSGINGVLRPGIVHRIDRDTSGLIIAAKNDFAHQALAAQLQDHSLARTYEAVAAGGFREDRGTVDAPIGRCVSDRKKMAVTDRGGRPAVTHWETLERFSGYTHIRCRLETGRTHQIRVHMAYIGHPILGDTVYGAKKPVSGLTGQCLHAAGLRFVHPRTGEAVELQCPLDAEFQNILEKLRRG